MHFSDDLDDASSTASGNGKAAGEFNLMAYLKPVSTEKGTVYGVFGADGLQLAVFGSREAAYFAAKQHDLEPVQLH